MEKIDEDILLFMMGVILLISTLVGLVVFVLVRNANRMKITFMEKQYLIAESKNARIREAERTMKEISREVHDNIGQCVHAMRANLHVIRRLAIEEKISLKIADTIELADQVLLDTKNIAHSLNSEFLKSIDIIDALKRLLAQTTTSGNINSKIEILGNEKKLFPDEKLIIFRIAQEILMNINKHAQATEILLKLEFGESSLSVSIEDNGIGFPVQEYTNVGIGLSNMRDRAELIHGQIIIDSKPGQGSCVSLWLPKIEFNEVSK